MEIAMGQKEARRLEVLVQVNEGAISNKEGARRLGLTARQMHRIRKRHAAEGVGGLISRRKGQSAKNRIVEAVQQTIKGLIETQYAGYGPTLVQEKLEERHGIKVSVESLRQRMIGDGQWKAKRGRNIIVHPLRQRRGRYGELIQIDGSPHHWFGDDKPPCTLLVMIDDATGNLMQLLFVPSESTHSYMRGLCGYIVQHGMPMALYSDRHSVFRVNPAAAGKGGGKGSGSGGGSEGEGEGESESQTQFGAALQVLGIDLICANSPQAKGRVERANRTLQDRLIKELRWQGMGGMEQGNAALPGFMADYNRRFGREPRELDDAHVAYTGSVERLKDILPVQATRSLSKNLTCSVDGRLLQLVTSGSGRGMRGAKVRIHWHFDGRLEVRRAGVLLPYQVVEKPPKSGAVTSAKELNARVDGICLQRGALSGGTGGASGTGTGTIAHKPAPNHPWRRSLLNHPSPLAAAAVGGALLQAAG